MTNAEKFLLNEKDAKLTVTAILKIFDGKSYSYANAALNMAKKYLNEESEFKAKNAIKKIEKLSEKKAEPAPKKKQ